MTMMSDLPEVLVEEVLSRVKIKSLGAVRSTCKLWNNLSKDRVLCNAEARQQFLGFLLNDGKLCSFRFVINGIQNEDVEFVEPSTVDRFNQVLIYQMHHSDGLLLLLLTPEEDNTKLVVWNSYLGQTRWIQPRDGYDLINRYAFGYDNNRNHKILMITMKDYAIFDLKSNSWRILDFIPNVNLMFILDSVSVKGNIYFFARGVNIGEQRLLCFDFSSERFGPYLPMPFHNSEFNSVVLSSFKEEQLAVLYIRWTTSETEIWVTTKIDSNTVSWSNFLKFDITLLEFSAFDRSFFIDQEKKLAVLFDIKKYNGRRCNIASIIGENGCLRQIDLGETHWLYDHPLLCSYTPSLVQISQGLDQDY